jgi:hypothetical protein
MEIVADRLRPAYRDGRWQMSVDAAHPRGIRALHYGIEMNNLSQGMNAGIGSPGANRPDWCSRDHPKARSSASCTVRPPGWLCQPW